MACMRQSSRCCLSDSLGCLSRSFPLARAMAMPSRVGPYPAHRRIQVAETPIRALERRISPPPGTDPYMRPSGGKSRQEGQRDRRGAGLGAMLAGGLGSHDPVGHGRQKSSNFSTLMSTRKGFFGTVETVPEAVAVSFTTHPQSTRSWPR